MKGWFVTVAHHTNERPVEGSRIAATRGIAEEEIDAYGTGNLRLYLHRLLDVAFDSILALEEPVEVTLPEESH